MGKAISQGNRRDKVFLMTKCCGRTAKDAQSHLEDSLRRLRTDHLDLWQFHEIVYDNDPDWIFAAGGAIETALKAKEQGKIRFLGFTGHKDPSIHLKMLDKPYPWATVQMPLNVMDGQFRSFQQKVLPVLNQRGIGADRHEEPGRHRQDRQRRRGLDRGGAALRVLAADRDAGLGDRLGEGARAEPQDRPRIQADDRRGEGRRRGQGPRGRRRRPLRAVQELEGLRRPVSSQAAWVCHDARSSWAWDTGCRSEGRYPRVIASHNS